MCFQTKITNWVSTKKTQSNADEFSFFKGRSEVWKMTVVFPRYLSYRDAHNFALLFSKRASKNGKNITKEKKTSYICLGIFWTSMKQQQRNV